VDREVKALAEVFGEGLDLFGLGALGAAHAEGEADDDFFHHVFADEAVEVLEIVPFVFALKRFETLGGDAEGVRDCYTNPASANVKTEHASGCVAGSHEGIIEGFRLSAPGGFRMSAVALSRNGPSL
jgi:hypothetical protein